MVACESCGSSLIATRFVSGSETISAGGICSKCLVYRDVDTEGETGFLVEVDSKSIVVLGVPDLANRHGVEGALSLRARDLWAKRTGQIPGSPSL